MQELFLDIPAGRWQQSQAVLTQLEQGQVQAGVLRKQGYDRLLLQTERPETLYDLLETVILQESMHWVLQEKVCSYRRLLEPEVYSDFQQQVQRRAEQIEPQLRGLIRQDLEQLLPAADSLNVQGYLQFAAKELKATLQRLLQEVYQRLASEQEQEEFIELLRFFISVQPPVLEQAYLTLYGEQFTLTDQWGNDLRQIYLDSLLEEEITGVSDNDLLMSILLTLLPRTIYLQVQERPKSAAFLILLQRVFGEQMVWQKTEQK